MEKDLIQPGYASGQLLDVVIAKTISGGWVDTVDVVSTAGRRQIAGYVLRQAVGTSRLYSTKFKITKSGQDYIFEGWGYGHGVGLCQWGANGMALAGHPYPEILTHYYPGAGILKIY
jgi:stage II sporulation protein D